MFLTHSGLTETASVLPCLPLSLGNMQVPGLNERTAIQVIGMSVMKELLGTAGATTEKPLPLSLAAEQTNSDKRVDFLELLTPH